MVGDRGMRVGWTSPEGHLLAVALLELHFFADGALDEPGDLVLAADGFVVDDPARCG